MALIRFLESMFTAKIKNFGLAVSPLWSQNYISVCLFSALNSDVRRPKQPLNSYMIYLQEQRLSMNMENPRDVIKSVAIQWKQLSDTEKQPYILKQKQLQEKYRTEVASYKSLLSKEEKQMFLEDFRKKKADRQRRIHKKAVQKTNPPKRNRNAFNLYVQSRFSGIKVTSLSEAMELMKDANSTWKNMFSHQRQPFIEQAAQDKQRYATEMEQYVNRMKMDGKVELLPLKHQKRIKRDEKKKQKTKKA